MRTREGMSIVLLSLYLPCSAHPLSEYVAAIGVVDETVARGISRKHHDVSFAVSSLVVILDKIIVNN